MRRCSTTDGLLDGAFAGNGLTRDQAAHASACPECAHAVALARRFDSELDRIGQEMSPEPMPAAPELSAVSATDSPARERRLQLTGPRRVAAMIVATIAVGALVYVGGRWLGDLVRQEPMTGAPAVVTRSMAASLVGGRPEEVLVTEDGALAIRDLGLAMELVLVRATVDGPIANVIDSTPTGAGQTQFSAVTCGESDRLVRTDYVWGRWDTITDVFGPGVHLITDSNHMIFAYDRVRPQVDGRAQPVEPGDVGVMEFGPDSDTLLILEREGAVMHFGPASEFVERACLERDFDPAAEPIVPAELECTDWPEDEAVQFATTEALVTDDLLHAVREQQQMPLAAGRDELLAAAVGSIDKACQFKPPTSSLAEIVADLYGR